MSEVMCLYCGHNELGACLVMAVVLNGRYYIDQIRVQIILSILLLDFLLCGEREVSLHFSCYHGRKKKKLKEMERNLHLASTLSGFFDRLIGGWTMYRFNLAEMQGELYIHVVGRVQSCPLIMSKGQDGKNEARVVHVAEHDG